MGNTPAKPAPLPLPAPSAEAAVVDTSSRRPDGASPEGSVIEEVHLGRTRERYVVLKQLGEGGFGTVYKAQRMSDGRVVAIKLVTIQSSSPEQLERCRREVEILQQLDDPAIVKVLGGFLCGDGRRLCIVMEYLEGRNLAAILSERRELVPKEIAIKWFLQLVDTLAYLATKRVMHRDITPHNIMVVRAASGDMTVKLVDFGAATTWVTLDARNQTVVGKRPYLPPEMLYHDKDDDDGDALRGNSSGSGSAQHLSPHYDCGVDVWGLGCVLFEVLTGEQFWRRHDLGMIGLLSRSPEYLHVHVHDPAIRDLLKRMLHVNPRERIPIALLRENSTLHAWRLLFAGKRASHSAEHCRGTNPAQLYGFASALTWTNHQLVELAADYLQFWSRISPKAARVLSKEPFVDLVLQAVIRDLDESASGDGGGGGNGKAFVEALVAVAAAAAAAAPSSSPPRLPAAAAAAAGASDGSPASRDGSGGGGNGGGGGGGGGGGDGDNKLAKLLRNTPTELLARLLESNNKAQVLPLLVSLLNKRSSSPGAARAVALSSVCSRLFAALSSSPASVEALCLLLHSPALMALLARYDIDRRLPPLLASAQVQQAELGFRIVSELPLVRGGFTSELVVPFLNMLVDKYPATEEFGRKLVAWLGKCAQPHTLVTADTVALWNGVLARVLSVPERRAAMAGALCALFQDAQPQLDYAAHGRCSAAALGPVAVYQLLARCKSCQASVENALCWLCISCLRVCHHDCAKRRLGPNNRRNVLPDFHFQVGACYCCSLPKGCQLQRAVPLTLHCPPAVNAAIGPATPTPTAALLPPPLLAERFGSSSAFLPHSGIATLTAAAPASQAKTRAALDWDWCQAYGFTFETSNAAAPVVFYFEATLLQLPHLMLTIRGSLAVGLAPETNKVRSNHCLGWEAGEYALHADDGGAFAGAGRPVMRRFAPMLHETDVVGCGVTGQGVVFWTFNGVYLGPVGGVAPLAAGTRLFATVTSFGSARVHLRFAPPFVYTPHVQTDAWPRPENLHAYAAVEPLIPALLATCPAESHEGSVLLHLVACMPDARARLLQLLSPEASAKLRGDVAQGLHPAIIARLRNIRHVLYGSADAAAAVAAATAAPAPAPALPAGTSSPCSSSSPPPPSSSITTAISAIAGAADAERDEVAIPSTTGSSPLRNAVNAASATSSASTTSPSQVAAVQQPADGSGVVGPAPFDAAVLAQLQAQLTQQQVLLAKMMAQLPPKGA